MWDFLDQKECLVLLADLGLQGVQVQVVYLVVPVKRCAIFIFNCTVTVIVTG